MSSTTANFEYNAPTDFRIAQLPADLDPAEQTAFGQLYSAVQQIIFTFVNNCGVGPRNVSDWTELNGNAITLLSGNLNRFYIQASENISFGAAVNLFNSSGTLLARNANAADNTKPCRGFCTIETGINAGEIGEIQIGTGVIEISGLVIGSNYFLSATNGLVANTPAVAAGNIEQYLGFAIDEVHLVFNISYWIQH